MEDYKPNSNVSKREKNEKREEKPEKHIDPIVKGKVKTRKRSIIQRFTDRFTQEDGPSMGDYFVHEIFIPFFIKLSDEMITSAKDIILYGSAGKRSNKKSSGYSTVSYRSFYDDPRGRERERDRYTEKRNAYEFDDIEFETRGDAEDVLATLDDIRERYDGIVTVRDFYDLVGCPGRYTDCKYGWTSLRNAQVQRVSGGGYIIHFPKAMPID